MGGAASLMRFRLKSGYKHQVQGDVDFLLPGAIVRWIDPTQTMPPFLALKSNGAEPKLRCTLVVLAGYCFDGASGGMVDTEAALAGSLPHDALYQMIRHGVMPLVARQACDDYAYEVWVRAGMWRARALNAWWWLKVGGETAARAERQKPIREVSLIAG